MSNLSNPFESIIAQASKLPDSGIVQRYQNTGFNPLGLILIDMSGSMSEKLESGRRKVDVLREALSNMAYQSPIYQFANTCSYLGSYQAIPEPEGSTNLALAFSTIARREPKHVLLISDGCPDSRVAALVEARLLQAKISTLYIGLDTDKEAISFMEELAKIGMGVAEVCDISKTYNQPLLAPAIARLGGFCERE